MPQGRRKLELYLDALLFEGRVLLSPRIRALVGDQRADGLRWRDAPGKYGPYKTLYNRFVRWSRLGVFNRIFAELAGRVGEPDRLMIDATTSRP